MIICTVFLLSILIPIQVNGDCAIDASLLGDLKSWNIYGNISTVTSNTSEYTIGICISVNKVDQIGIIQKENSQTYNLGQLNQTTITRGDNWTMLTYDNGDSFVNACRNGTRSASIIFVCGDNQHSIKVVQEHSSKLQTCHYLFQYSIPALCPTVPQEKKGLSGGAIFFIIILCLASAYFIGGLLFMRIKHGARGIDQIPNLEMWRKLGNLAADGCDYCCRCKSNSQRAGYFIDETGPDSRGDDDILAP